MELEFTGVPQGVGFSPRDCSDIGMWKQETAWNTERLMECLFGGEFIFCNKYFAMDM